MDVPGLFVACDRLVGAAGRELAGGVALPLLALAAHRHDLDAAVALVDRAERRSRLDRLELLRVTDQHDLGAARLDFTDHPLQLPRADHPGLVDHQDVIGTEQLFAPAPLMLEASERSRRDARAVLEVLSDDARRGRTVDAEACRLPNVASHAEHRRLAGAGVADHAAEAARVGDPLERATLLG